MATPSYHPQTGTDRSQLLSSAAQIRVLIAIRWMAERLARDEVKQEIRDRGDKICRYASSQITLMARAKISANPGHYIGQAKASGLVAEIRAKEEAKELRKAQRKALREGVARWTITRSVPGTWSNGSRWKRSLQPADCRPRVKASGPGCAPLTHRDDGAASLVDAARCGRSCCPRCGRY